MRIPRKLTVSPNRAAPGTYVVLIGRTKVGSVRRNDRNSQTADVSYTFQPDPTAFPRKEDVPAPFDKITMQAIRQGLTEKISRDLYVKILEGSTHKPK